jgi:Mg-chelatase subunit ChlD
MPSMCTPQRLALAALLALIAAAGCGQSTTAPGKPGGPIVIKQGSGGTYHLDLPRGEPKPGTAVVVLVDTSGSMNQDVPDHAGKRRAKIQIAREALEHIVQDTAKWKKDHPKDHLELGIYHFSSSVAPVLPMGEFDQAKAEAALGRIPKPAGGTAIGRALEEGYKALYQTGCSRKFVVCVTDGENTSGPQPDWVARGLHAETEGTVELDFVAFDTKASQFNFLKEVNGHVVEAADGGQLQAELAKIYQQRILVEKEDAPDKK